MKQAEQAALAERKTEKERIAIQKEADEIFRRNEEEKAARKRTDAENVSQFRVTQAVGKFHLIDKYFII